MTTILRFPRTAAERAKRLASINHPKPKTPAPSAVATKPLPRLDVVAKAA